MLQDIHAMKFQKDIIEDAILELIKTADHTTISTTEENSDLCCNETLKPTCANETVKIPVHTIGPVKINGNVYNIPIATRNISLVENLNEIARVLFDEGVISKSVHKNTCVNSVVRFKSSKQTGQALLWLNNPKNFKLMKYVYENSCRMTILCQLHGSAAGPFLSIRFTLQHQQDDSMEIRNVTKGAVAVLGLMKQIFDNMKIVSCTGDLRCSEDKSCVGGDASSSQTTRLMTMEGTGDCVVSQALVSTQLIRKTLKCSLQDLILAQKLKNLIDGSTGGLNLQAANILSSVYIAVGKNPIGTILRSSCTTTFTSAILDPSNPAVIGLKISCTFPSLYSSDLNIKHTEQIASVKYENVIDNFKDIVSTLVLISELDQLRELAVNLALTSSH